MRLQRHGPGPCPSCPPPSTPHSAQTLRLRVALRSQLPLPASRTSTAQSAQSTELRAQSTELSHSGCLITVSCCCQPSRHAVTPPPHIAMACRSLAAGGVRVRAAVMPVAKPSACSVGLRLRWCAGSLATHPTHRLPTLHCVRYHRFHTPPSRLTSSSATSTASPPSTPTPTPSPSPAAAAASTRPASSPSSAPIALPSPDALRNAVQYCIDHVKSASLTHPSFPPYSLTPPPTTHSPLSPSPASPLPPPPLPPSADGTTPPATSPPCSPPPPPAPPCSPSAPSSSTSPASRAPRPTRA